MNLGIHLIHREGHTPSWLNFLFNFFFFQGVKERKNLCGFVERFAFHAALIALIALIVSLCIRKKKCCQDKEQNIYFLMTVYGLQEHVYADSWLPSCLRSCSTVKENARTRERLEEITIIKYRIKCAVRPSGSSQQWGSQSQGLSHFSVYRESTVRIIWAWCDVAAARKDEGLRKP